MDLPISQHASENNSKPSPPFRRRNTLRPPIQSALAHSEQQSVNTIHSELHRELKQNDLQDTPLVSDELTEIEAQTRQPNIVQQFNTLRTKQLTFIVLLVMVFAFINNFVNQQSEITTVTYIVAFVFFLGCYLLAYYDKSNLAAKLLLWGLYATATSLMLTNDGLRDPVTIGYTGILIFAALLGSKRHFMALCIVMGFSFLLVGYANDIGWVEYPNSPFGWGVVFDLLILFSVISYTLWTLSSDLRFALSSLEVENFKVNQSKQKFQKIAHFDHLTGLPNRIIAQDRFNQAVSHAHRSDEKIAVFFLDLDNFKTVNDSLGHAIGDKLLQEVSSRLVNSVREGDTVCRLGGDEFLVILDGIDSSDNISRIANDILTNISQSLNIDEQDLKITCSIGIAVSPTDSEDFDVLRKMADMAMYRAKNAGRNGFMFFDEEMNTGMLAHIDRINGLRNAVVNREFVLHYQPKIHLTSGAIFSAEALIRWQTPGGELIGPDEFISIAENTGMIIEIGEWVLYEACKQCKEFQQQGLEDFSIAVNLSSIQFRRGNLEDIVVSALASANLDASYLELEVTESLLVEDSDGIRAQIKSLQDIGVTFSIDDFGTGYSSLSYLRDFNFDYLKIDRSFIRNNMDNDDDMILCEAIIGLAHKLKLMVVAEGLETQQQKEALHNAGCEFGQGNYFSKPVPVKDFYQLKSLRRVENNAP